jgi:hypothetical protein
MAIFASLRYLGKECMKIQETSIVLQVQFNGFKSKDGNGNFIIAFRTQLNIPCCVSSLENDLTLMQPMNLSL